MRVIVYEGTRTSDSYVTCQITELSLCVGAGHATGDTFVNKRHTERLFTNYAGEKELCFFEGDHNSMRTPQFYGKVGSDLEIDDCIASSQTQNSKPEP